MSKDKIIEVERLYTGIFDSHAHYDSSRFDHDREEVLAALRGAGLTVLDVKAEEDWRCVTAKK